MMAFMVLYTIALELFVIFQCNPIDGAWEIFEGAKYMNQTPGVYTNSTLNILSDLLLIIFVVLRVGKWQLYRSFQRLHELTMINQYR
jgi:hypothetical protein